MSEVKEYLIREYGDKIYFGAPQTLTSKAGEIDVEFALQNVSANLITSLLIQPFNVGGTMILRDQDRQQDIMQLLNAFTDPLQMPFDYVTFGSAIRFKFDTVNVYFSIVYENLYSRDGKKIKIEDLFLNSGKLRANN